MAPGATSQPNTHLKKNKRPNRLKVGEVSCQRHIPATTQCYCVSIKTSKKMLDLELPIELNAKHATVFPRRLLPEEETIADSIVSSR